MQCTTRSVGVAMVGYGYWGPNLVRNLIESRSFHLAGLCELDQERATDFSRRYPHLPVVRNLDDLLASARVEAVIVATPPSTHFALAAQALAADKHVLVEKPLAMCAEDAEELIALAGERGLVLMPGHTFVYSPRVQKIREMLAEGQIGEPYFVTSSRMNLGRYQPDGVIYDLAPHDLSILLYLFNQPVVQVAASGLGVLRSHVPETAFLTVQLRGGPSANIQISWLAPRKVRQMVIVGSKRMIQYEDTAPEEAVRVYDRGFDVSDTPANFGEYQLTYRSGDMVAPRIEATEPLAIELADFASAIVEGTVPRSDHSLGLEIVRVLEAAALSMAGGGHPVAIDHGDDVAAGAVATNRLHADTNGGRPGNGNGHRVENGHGGDHDTVRESDLAARVTEAVSYPR
jgi:predicted dehydrogenase